MCDQQSLRSACAYAKSDQSLCYSLEYSLSVKLLTEHHLEFLSLKGGCTGSYECTLVKMPHCWKSHATAQIINKYNQKFINLIKLHIKPGHLHTSYFHVLTLFPTTIVCSQLILCILAKSPNRSPTFYQ